MYADAVVDSLAQQLELVAWDREQLVGQLQTRVAELAGARPSVRPGPPLRVVERRLQPLEAIDTAWGWLRRGRAVRVSKEPDACSAALDVLRELVPELAEDMLTIDDEPAGPLPPGYQEGGVDAPGPRVAIIDADADRELAAYVLARTGLRRSGLDPRGVKVAYAAGALDLMQRHLRRLWVGVRVGPADDPESFAGPVPPALREQYEAAHADWTAHPDVTVWCRGGVLARAGDPRCYLAPALFHVVGPPPPLPLVGPMMVVSACDQGGLLAAARAVRAEGGQVVQIGGRPGAVPGVVRHVRGALLVERLPPGLPEPRPV